MKKNQSKESLSLAQLSAEDLAALKTQWQQEEKKKAETIRQQRQNYKQLVDSEMQTLFPLLVQTSRALSAAKKYVIDNLQGLVKLKAALYDKEEDQTSHSFSTADGDITILIGYNMLDGWDDTVNTGIAKVNDYLQSLVTDKKSKDLVEQITKLMAKAAKGSLKASRVLQLRQWADKAGDKGFVDAIQIIQDAYRPARSKEFVRCLYKAPNGEKKNLALDITDALLDFNDADFVPAAKEA